MPLFAVLFGAEQVPLFAVLFGAEQVPLFAVLFGAGQVPLFAVVFGAEQVPLLAVLRGSLMRCHGTCLHVAMKRLRFQSTLRNPTSSRLNMLSSLIARCNPKPNPSSRIAASIWFFCEAEQLGSPEVSVWVLV